MMSGKLDVVGRTKRFALRIIRLYSSLPKSTEAQILGKQMFRSGTSVGAHVREAKRSRSDAEMISKIEVALQELEETMYWLELLQESDVIQDGRPVPLLEEANELIAILVTATKTIKKRRR